MLRLAAIVVLAALGVAVGVPLLRTAHGAGPSRGAVKLVSPGGERGLAHPRGVLLHELGHVYDLTVLNNTDRGRFRRVMRQPHAKWWKAKRPLAEWFAEGYSWCARFARIASIKQYAIYRCRPTAAQHRQVCALIKRAARDRTPPAPPTAPSMVTGDPAPPAPPPVSEGVVPGDTARDPGPGPPESPTATPSPTWTPPPVLPPVPVPTVVPTPPIVLPTATSVG